MSRGEVSVTTFVWCEGMGDWKVMTEVSAFAALTQPSGGGTAGTGISIRKMSGLQQSQAPQSAQLAPQLAQPIAVQDVQPAHAHGIDPLSPINPQNTVNLLNPSESAGISIGADLLQPEYSSPAIHDPAGGTKPTILVPAQAGDTLDIANPGLRGDPAAEMTRGAVFPEIGTPVGTVAPGGKKSSGKLKLLLVFVLLGGGVYAGTQGYLAPVLENQAVKDAGSSVYSFLEPYLMSAAEKFPALSEWISPLPKLDGVTPDEYQELKAAAMSPIDQGARAAMSLLATDLISPSFYIATNLPDGANFEILVEGVPSTLLNHMSFTSRVFLTADRRLGKSPAVRFPDGKPIPRGEYKVYLYETDQQPATVTEALASTPVSAIPPAAGIPPNRKLLTQKIYFLGGPKDATYATRLKEYHDKLLARATAELNEVRQFISTLEAQFSGTNTQFERFRKMKANRYQQKLALKGWNDYHTRWSQLDGQLTETFAKWTPELMQQEFFYGVLYQELIQVGKWVSKVHEHHHQFFSGPTDPKVFATQLTETQMQAQNAINLMKAKIEQAAKLGTTPNGMPIREGL